jgi:hypothetical protein
MSIITSQKLVRYFEQYGTIEVTFNKQVIDVTGLVANNVFLKILDLQWPCVVYSASMSGARVIAGSKSQFFDSLRQANNHVSLRFCFRLPEKIDPISFFVPSRVSGYTQYNPKNPAVQLIAMEFTQRPPDDLIQVLGILLEANANAQRRKDERIILTPESIRKLGLESKESFIYVEGVPRKCIVRDLSFGGAKVLVTGIAKFLSHKKATLKLIRGDPSEELQIPGEITRVENVADRKDIVALAVEFTQDTPITYKLLINGYLTSVRKSGEPAEAPSPPKPASSASPGAGDGRDAAAAKTQIRSRQSDA